MPSSSSSVATAPAAVRPRSGVRVPKAAELVAGRLRNDIIRGSLAEGSALPSESALMDEFGVSRPTLREAFRVLESEALITVSRGSRGGARVQVPKTEVAARYAALVLRLRGASLRDVLDTQAAIEPPLAARLARRRTTADLESLREALQESKVAVGDAATLSQHRFHRLVIELAGNRTAEVIMDILDHIVEAAMLSRSKRSAAAAAESSQHAGFRSHERLLQAIEARDADAAERLWRKHLDETTKWLGEDASTLTITELLS